MGGKWGALIVLSAAQFLMVLDQSVMNVSISQLVADFDTTVTTIQAVITLYALVMAALMLTGGKLGDLFGRRRVFVIGLVIYGVGSALTAASWSVPTLTLGWSVLEGIGAAMVLPASSPWPPARQRTRPGDGLRSPRRGRGRGYRGGSDPRRLADDEPHVAARVRGRGGPRDRDPPVRPAVARARARGERPALDWVGSVLSALGLSLIVFGVLQASNWGGWSRATRPSNRSGSR